MTSFQTDKTKKRTHPSMFPRWCPPQRRKPTNEINKACYPGDAFRNWHGQEANSPKHVSQVTSSPTTKADKRAERNTFTKWRIRKRTRLRDELMEARLHGDSYSGWNPSVCCLYVASNVHPFSRVWRFPLSLFCFNFPEVFVSGWSCTVDWT